MPIRSASKPNSQRASINFQSLVHQVCRIDRNLGAHIPGRMAQRIGNRCRFHLGLSPGAKGTTRGGQDNARTSRAFHGRHLCKAIVFRIRPGNNSAPDGLSCPRHLTRAGHHERLFVCQRDSLLPASSAAGSTKTDAPTVAETNAIRLRVGGYFAQPFLSNDDTGRSDRAGKVVRANHVRLPPTPPRPIR